MFKPAVLAIAAVLLPALPAAAQVDGDQFRRFQQEAEAFNEGKSDVDRFRAGFYGGYLSGMLEALEGRSVCFKGTRCELEDKLVRHLADNPVKRDQPAAAWLVKLLEKWYPCPK